MICAWGYLFATAYWERSDVDGDGKYGHDDYRYKL